MKKAITFVMLLCCTLQSIYAQNLQTSAFSSFGNAGWETVMTTEPDVDGNYYIYGSFTNTITLNQELTSLGKRDLFLAKVTGETVDWSIRLGGDYDESAHSILLDGSSIYLTGSFKGEISLGNDTHTSTTFTDGFFAVLDLNGNVQTSKIIDYSVCAHKIFLDNDNEGNIFLAGTFKKEVDFDGTELSSNGKTDIFLVKYNNQGNFENPVRFGGKRKDELTCFKSGNVGELIFGGWFEKEFEAGSNTLSSNGKKDAFLLKTDQTGQVIFAGNFGGAYNDVLKAITYDKDYNLYIAGEFQQKITINANEYATGKTKDVFLAQLSPTNDMIWSKSIQTDESDDAYVGVNSLVVFDNGALYLAGSYNGTLDGHLSNEKSKDAYIARFNIANDERDWVLNAGHINEDAVKLVKGEEAQLITSGFFSGSFTIDGTSFTNKNYKDGYYGKVVDCDFRPVVDLTGNEIACGGVLNAGEGFAEYAWSTGETTPSITVSQDGEYSVTVIGELGCQSTSTVVTEIREGFPVDLGPDVEQCADNSVQLDAGTGGTVFTWNDGNTQQTRDITESGTYSVMVEDGERCGKDEVEIILNEVPVVDLGADAILFEGQELELIAGWDGTFLWNDGSTEHKKIVSESGTYSVVVTSDKLCEATDEIIVTKIPNPVVNYDNLGTTSADALFTTHAAADSYEIRSKETSGSTYTTNTITSAPYTMTGLLPGGEYDVQVRPLKNSYTPLDWEHVNNYPLSIPDNNTKDGAVELPNNGEWCSNEALFYNSFASGDNITTPCWTESSDNTMWFSFTADDELAKITVKTGDIDGQDYGTMRGQQIAIWDEAGAMLECDELSHWESGNLTINLVTLTPGSKYFISVDDRSKNGTFTICMGKPDYDFIQAAEEIEDISNYCSDDAQFSNAEASHDVGNGTCWKEGSKRNVWFSFTTTNVVANITVKTGGDYGNMKGQQIALWDKDWEPVTCIKADYGFQGELLLKAADLIPNEKYYISVDDRDDEGSFTLCINNELDFNYKEAAEELTELDNWCSEFSNEFATGDELKGGNWTSDVDNNVWFSFIADSPIQKITLRTGNDTGVDYGDMRYQQVAVWDENGAEVTSAEATVDEGDLVINLLTLTTGSKYYISVDAATVNGETENGNFTICMGKPDYDFKQAAKEIADMEDYCSGDAQFSNEFASFDVGEPDCWSGESKRNVWFSFTATNEVAFITVKTGGVYGEMKGQQIALWDNAGVSIACANADYGFSGDLELKAADLTVGQKYYISVDDRDDEGTFTLCMGRPSYDFKEGAHEITVVNNYCSDDAQFSTAAASTDQGPGTCWDENGGKNVWFKFIPENTIANISIKTGGAYGTMVGQQMAVYDNTGAQIACAQTDNDYTGELVLNISNLVIGDTYHMQVDDRDDEGSFTLCIDNMILNWTGAVSSDWGNTGNWSPARVPTSTDNVIIPDAALTSNAPNISTIVSCNYLDIETGGILNIAGGGGLTANGDFINNGLLMLKSPANNCITGTFIDNGNISGNGLVKVERYINSNHFRYMSSPINGGNSHSGMLTAFGANFNPNLYFYNEAFDLNGNPATPPAGVFDQSLLSNAWVTVQPSAGSPQVPLLPTEGFSFYTNINGNITFEANLGTGDLLNTGDNTVSGLTFTNNDPMPAGGDQYDGWNLIGNPYPSCIDWDLINSSLTNLRDAIYVWDNTQYSNYVNGISGGAGNQNNIIAPMQSVMVQATANNAGFALNNSHRVHSSGATYKGARAPKTLVRLRLSANEKVDDMVVYFDAMASKEFDSQLDALRLFSWDNKQDDNKYADVPHIFSITEAEKDLTINALPEESLGQESIPVGIRLGTSGTYTLRVKELSVYGQDIYLIDNELRKSIRISEDDTYTFEHKAGESRKRFELSFADKTEEFLFSGSGSDEIIYPNPNEGKFFISMKEPEKVTKIEIYNAKGGLVKSIEKVNKTTIEVNLGKGANGTYMVIIEQLDGISQYKVIIE